MVFIKKKKRNDIKQNIDLENISIIGHFQVDTQPKFILIIFEHFSPLILSKIRDSKQLNRMIIYVTLFPEILYI